MDYLFENLGDERFQELSHVLITKEFPNAQAFPVGQPDGGRDSVVWNMMNVHKEFNVYQIKFVRNANTISDQHKWLLEIIQQEAPKIKKLIPKGAKNFYIITNVKGTAHLDAGSIDKLNKILEDNIEIPSMCWWREDLSRKLEANPIIKWSFPEILNAQDIFNSILFDGINENKDRRESTIRAYVEDQYKLDNQVKFKQIDLQQRLLEIFTDVPIRIKKFNEKNFGVRRAISILHIHYHRRMIIYEDVQDFEEKGSIVGAAEFLLNSLVQKNVERLLLEGGPGQGKSTISQYICQIHRIRLLNKRIDLQLMPEKFKSVPIRLPLKIDLRDVAAWVEKRNPYPSSLSEEYFKTHWQNSLESFIVSHIFYHSKIENFDTNDLVAVCRISSILFVFDGFDEIANINAREQIIDFINNGLDRLSINAKSIQTIITSRPAAFSNSLSFSTDQYPHFELSDITESITKEYVEKWIKSRRLDTREASDIRRLVDLKLNMPHLKDLAKSPMQLAILLSLLNTRGESLPNKRTALYDSYVDLFFNRESEKNSTIRDNRDLIIDLHQYLAWILHSEAELYQNNGRLELNDLKNRLKEYLKKEGHKTNITDQLFDVMKERVCALVSRVQGTFEFEVQPLREYFCARYLYNTSPYSPPGQEKSGAKPERFDAMSKNFYWQNVVRFFAGCFDKGELPMLIHELNELQEDILFKYTNYPRVLTSQLLSDWVFTQYPNLLKSVVSIIVNGINIGQIINQESNNSNEPILLPDECGRQEMIQECFEELIKFPAIDYAYELIGIIKNNPFEVVEQWERRAISLTDEKLTLWLHFGYRLEILHKCNEEILLKIVNSDLSETTKRLQILVLGNRFNLIDKTPDLKDILFNDVLSAKVVVPQKYKNNSITFLATCLSPSLLTRLFEIDMSVGSILMYFDRLASKTYQRHFNEKQSDYSIVEFEVKDAIDELIKRFSNSIYGTLDSDISIWRTKFEPWDKLVETGRAVFGESWSLKIIATIAAAIKDKDLRFEEFDNLSDESISLVKRVRCARMKSGNPTWWQKQIETSTETEFALLVFFNWATPKTIFQLSKLLNEKINDLDNNIFLKLASALKTVGTLSKFNPVHETYINSLISKNNLSNRFLFILSFRFNENRQFVYENISEPENEIQQILDLRLQYLMRKYVATEINNEIVLKEIKDIYTNLRHDKILSFGRYRYHENETKLMPYEIAKVIMSDCKNYPRVLASMAERSCRIYANKKLIPVGEISKKEKWFEQDSL